MLLKGLFSKDMGSQNTLSGHRVFRVMGVCSVPPYMSRSTDRLLIGTCERSLIPHPMVGRTNERL